MTKINELERVPNGLNCFAHRINIPKTAQLLQLTVAKRGDAPIQTTFNFNVASESNYNGYGDYWKITLDIERDAADVKISI